MKTIREISINWTLKMLKKKYVKLNMLFQYFVINMEKHTNAAFLERFFNTKGQIKDDNLYSNLHLYN